jgi:hypothetical protein
MEPYYLGLCHTHRQVSPFGGFRALDLVFISFSYLGRVKAIILRSELFGRPILLLIIYKGIGQGEVTNSINLSATQLEGCVTNRPGCHLARDCLCWDCSPRIAMMTNVIDIFY